MKVLTTYQTHDGETFTSEQQAIDYCMSSIYIVLRNLFARVGVDNPHEVSLKAFTGKDITIVFDFISEMQEINRYIDDMSLEDSE